MMNGLLQMIRSYWTPWGNRLPQNPRAGLDTEATARDSRESPAEVTQNVIRYRTLIELRELLQTFPEPAQTTVVLVLDSARTVHLPTLLARDSFALCLILTTSAGSLLGTTSPGDLALQARAWGWNSIAFQRDCGTALAAARESIAGDERLLIFAPGWLTLSAATLTR